VLVKHRMEPAKPEAQRKATYQAKDSPAQT